MERMKFDVSISAQSFHSCIKSTFFGSDCKIGQHHHQPIRTKFLITKHSFPLKTAHKSLWFLASSSCMKRNPCSQQSPTRTPQVTAKGLSQTDALKMPRVRPQYPVPGARPSRIPAPRSWSYLNIKVVQLLSLPFFM